jgi:rhodanese-related sulfurtransferase
MRALIVVLFALLSGASCNSQNAGVKNLNPGDFEKGIAQKNMQLVDVRTPEEYQEKHIAGAKNMNINDPGFEKQMLELDKTKPL